MAYNQGLLRLDRSRLIPAPETMRRLALLLGWSALTVVVFATLSPLGLRPRVPAVGVGVERFAAFFFLTATFGFAYPHRRWQILAGVVVLAVGLEWLQNLEGSRHGRVTDVVEKIAGALGGTLVAMAADRLMRRAADRLKLRTSSSSGK